MAVIVAIGAAVAFAGEILQISCLVRGGCGAADAAVFRSTSLLVSRTVEGRGICIGFLVIGYF